MSDEYREQTALAVRIAEEASAEERLLLAKWLGDLLTIRSSNLSNKQKALRAFASTRDNRVLQQIVGRIAVSVKRYGWDRRTNTQRLGIAVAVATATVFGSANAGIAALGGAVAVPLWIVFGAGSMFAKTLYDELSSRRTGDEAASYTILDAHKQDK